ncbi:MAG TPA: gas vesicle protein GvpJ [Solirubrobacterales bacterium]|jgi:hypothetical protein|nr:gas vesicle protein GvpJ [Solirubrobacterales bacterium]
MADERESSPSLYNRRPMDQPRMEVQRAGGPANLADILERVLDKGIVIAGDIQINLLDIELLTIKLRLLVASVERAQEMGINWWESDPSLSSRAKELEEENEDLRSRLDRLEEMAGLPAPRAGEEVEVETHRREVVEQGPGGRRRVRDEDATKDELMETAQALDIPGRSSMTKDELVRAVEKAQREATR